MPAGNLTSYKRFRKPGDLLRVYRSAFEEASQTDNPDVKISAYNRVINFCGESSACRIDGSIKRNRIMYWSFNNLGDALVSRPSVGEEKRKQDRKLAISYYREALNLARDEDEKIVSLNKIAEIYAQLEDKENLKRTSEDIVESLGDQYKRFGYVKLAESRLDTAKSAEWLEKALEYVTKEEVSFLTKCRNTLAIGEMLLQNYRAGHDENNIKRIRRLLNNTAVLAIRALEEKAAVENRRDRQLELFGETAEITEKFCAADKSFRAATLQKIAEQLRDDEVVYIDGTAFNRNILKRLTGITRKKH